MSIDILKEMANFTYVSKYARYDEKKQRRETWLETVSRVEKMHLDKFSTLADEHKAEIKWAFDMVREKLVVPSMRSMQFAGKAIEAHNSKLYNCCVLHITQQRSFAEFMYLLLNGCGVSFSVQKQFIDRLPNLVSAKDKTGTVLTYVVEDTIEGWADSIEALISCYFKNTAFTGRKITFDYSKIRAEGAELKTSGGRAPGYKGLKNAHIKIKKLLDNVIEVRHQTRLNSIDVYDILMHCSDAVLSGGVRRSATLALFDKNDTLMLNAKTGNWFKENPQRARSNNSCLIDRNNVTKKEFIEIIKHTKEFGEPGFVFTNGDMGFITNPCCEVGFIPITKDGRSGVQMCVAGNTNLITREGLSTIESLVDKEVEIWNGQKWSKVIPYQTGISDDLYRVSFSDGSYLDATANHKFLIKHRFEKDYREVETLDLMEELANSSYPISVPKANFNDFNFGKHEEYAYEYGFFLGDGHVDHDHPCAYLFGDKIDLPLRGSLVDKDYYNEYGTLYKVLKFEHLDLDLCKSLKLETALVETVATWDRDSILRFVAGWLDADGSNASKGVRLYGSYKNLSVMQLLLSKCGLVASLNLMAKKGQVTNFGTRTYDMWYLQITKTDEIPCNRLICNNASLAKFKGKFQIVRKVEKIASGQPSYCLTEDNLHQCVFNNVLTKQCNLSEINGKKINTLAKFKDAAKAAAIIGTLQASYTDFPYLSLAAKELTEEEALLGVSVTGFMENPDILLNEDNQQICARVAVNANKKWAKILGIKQAARVTVCKPSGTASIVLETSCSGIHPAHAKKFFRRIQMNKKDPIYQWFKVHNPEACEPSVWSANKTDDVVTFPIEVSDKTLLKANLSAIEHLEIIRSTQRNWVSVGTTKANTKDIEHSISCTVVVKDDEWDTVANYIYENRHDFTAVSLIAATGDKDYQQAPFEAVLTEEDEAKFNKLVASFKSVDYTSLLENSDLTELQKEIACTGGVCMV